MKLTLGFTALLLACAVTAQAQGTSVGIRAGVNFADLAFSSSADAPDSKILTGLVAGVFVVAPINDTVAFQPEVLVSMQGTKFTEGTETAKIKIDYIQVPLLGRFKLGAKSPVAVLVGPSIGFRNRAKIVVSGQPDEDFKEDVEKTDIGLVTGLSVDVGHLVLDGRYTWGLKNIAKDSPGSDPSDTAKNRVFSASVGIRF